MNVQVPYIRSLQDIGNNGEKATTRKMQARSFEIYCRQRVCRHVTDIRSEMLCHSSFKEMYSQMHKNVGEFWNKFTITN